MHETISRDAPRTLGASPDGLLKINAPHGFGRRVLAPALSAFACRYPSVDVMLHLSERPMDIVDQGFDAAIRIGDPTDPRLHARRLRGNRRVLCAAPAYLKQRGRPLTIDDLPRHQAILLEEDDQPYGRWRLRRGDVEQTIDVHGAMHTNDGETAVRWALDGLGILLRSEWDIGADLRAGRLVAIVPQWTMPADIWAVTPASRRPAQRTRLFLDWLAQRLAH